MKKIKFEELTLSKEVHKAIAELGFEMATPIQSAAIPVLLKGKDIIGQAQTGTGKTAAFGIPAIEAIDGSSKELQILILCPTRELAIQVAEEMGKFAHYRKDIFFLPVYGGQPIERQLKAIKKGVHVIIGTPGRIIDHIERGTLNLGKIKMVILDEADEMLDMGFIEDIEQILKHTPKSRQTVMFSATMPKGILELTKKYLNKPENIKVVHEVLTVSNTEQIYFELKEKNKLEALSRVIDLYNLKLSLVFCNTKRGVDELTDQLKVRGYLAEALHGDMRQSARERVLSKFRNNSVEVLVATDVAARGLDVENVEAVFNYDMPQDEEYYVHRIGRTGRAGKTGKAFTFVTGKEIFKLRVIQKYIKTKINLHKVPSYDDVEEVRENKYLDEIKKLIDDSSPSEQKKYIHLVERLINDDYTTIDIAAALIKKFLSGDKKAGGAKEDMNSKEGMQQVRLFLNIGRKDKVRPGDILGAITGETGIKGNAIGEINLYDKFSFVNVQGGFADTIIEELTGRKIKGKKINVEYAETK